MHKENPNLLTTKAAMHTGNATRVTPTSLNPYGQLLRILQPRANNIAIYGRDGLLLWASTAAETAELHDLVQDICTQPTADSQAMSVALNGEAAYLLPVLDQQQKLLGLVTLTCELSGNDERALESLCCLLRPALEVLTRELGSQYDIEHLQRDLRVRDKDLMLLLGDAADGHQHGKDETHDADDLARLLGACLTHLECALGTLLVPGKNIALYRAAPTLAPGAGSSITCP